MPQIAVFPGTVICAACADVMRQTGDVWRDPIRAYMSCSGRDCAQRNRVVVIPATLVDVDYRRDDQDG